MYHRQLHLTRISPLRIVIVLLALAAIFYVAIQLTTLDTILALLLQSSWGWMSLAVLAMFLTFIMSAVIQYIAGDNTGRIRDLVTLGFAGSFFNHFLPFSVGGIALLAEYYHKIGQRRSQSIMTASAPIAIGAVTTFAIALIISPLTLMDLIHNYSHLLSSRTVQLTILLVSVFSLLLVMLFWDRIRGAVREAVAEIHSLHSIQQIGKVAAGSILMTIVAAFVLYASIQAVHAQVTYIVVAVIFIATLLVSELAPTPGGIGATEATLILGLSGAGLTVEQAVAATLVFRFISFLLPMIPGAIVLPRLNHLLGLTWHRLRNGHT
jgi:undecaprenyl-diphosphatase